MQKRNQNKGRILFVLASFVIVFVLGLSSLLAETVSNSNSGAVSTTEPWQSTLSAIMMIRTAYAKLYPSPTVTLMSADDVSQTVVQKTNTTHELDPLEMTATYIVSEAIGTLVAIVSVIQDSDLPTASITPMPTYSLAELSQQKKLYLNKLVKIAGFSSPAFEDIANSLLVEEVLSNQYVGLDELEPVAQSISFGGSKYTVLVVTSVKYGVFLSQILLFRVTNQDAVLLDNPSILDLDSFVYVGLDERGFADMNGNSLPDITVYTSYGGNCCLPQLHILEIQSDFQITDIAPKATDIYPARLMDLNDDGVPEIQGQSPASGTSTIWLIRWFGWSGHSYVDISSQHPELYLSQINLLEQELFSPERCNRGYFSLELENYLVNFYAMGHLSDGWSKLQRLLKRHCSTDDLQKAEDVLKDIEHWMNSLPKS